MPRSHRSARNLSRRSDPHTTRATLRVHVIFTLLSALLTFNQGLCRIHLNTERWRVCETWFSPAMAGVDSAGLGEVIQNVLARFPDSEKERLVKVMSFRPNIGLRTHAHYRMCSSQVAHRSSLGLFLDCMRRCGRSCLRKWRSILAVRQTWVRTRGAEWRALLRRTSLRALALRARNMMSTVGNASRSGGVGIGINWSVLILYFIALCTMLYYCASASRIARCHISCDCDNHASFLAAHLKHPAQIDYFLCRLSPYYPTSTLFLTSQFESLDSAVFCGSRISEFDSELERMSLWRTC
jgi:hypothetical protein